MEGTMGHLRWSRYPLVPLVWRFTIMGDLPSLFKKKKNICTQICLKIFRLPILSAMHVNLGSSNGLNILLVITKL